MKKILVLLFTILGVNQLFARGTLDLVNTQTLDMNLVETLRISYSSDNIVLLESNDNNLILKEFMTRNRPEYFANIYNSQSVLSISNGERPWQIRTRIEVYIPKTFTDNLIVNLRSGNLTANYGMSHKTINISVSSGNLEINSISSENAVVEVSSGNITIDELIGKDLSVRSGSGNIKINSFQGEASIVNRSGNIAVNNFVGKGTLEVRSGNIDLTVNDIIGDITLSSNSGNIDFIMGRNISFILDAEVGSGNVRIPNLTGQIKTIAKYNIGINPIYGVFAKCGSGNLNIR